MQAEAAKGEEEEEPAGLCLFDLVLGQPAVVVAVGRHGLLEERVDFGRHAGRRIVAVDKLNVDVGIRVWGPACRRVAAKGHKLGSWFGAGVRGVESR